MDRANCIYIFRNIDTHRHIHTYATTIKERDHDFERQHKGEVYKRGRDQREERNGENDITIS